MTIMLAITALPWGSIHSSDVLFYWQILVSVISLLSDGWFDLGHGDDFRFVSLQGSWLPEINTRGTSDQHSRPVSRCTCYDRHVHRCQSQLQAPTATRGGNHPVDSVTAATWIQRRSPRRCMKKPVHRFESELLAAAADDRDVRILLNGDRIHLDWFCHLSVWVWSS